MKSNDIRELTNEELQQKLRDLKSEFFNLRFQLATGQLNNPAGIKNVKRDIARVKTIIRENEIKASRAAK